MTEDFIPIFDAANRLCEMNGGIRNFSDINRTDVKKLQLALENEMGQSQIMEIDFFLPHPFPVYLLR